MTFFKRLSLRQIVFKKGKGQITVWLSLMFLVFLSLYLVCLQSVQKQQRRQQAEQVSQAGLFSLFSEYEPHLLERYDLFYLDTSFGSGREQVDELCSHLWKFVLEASLLMPGFCLLFVCLFFLTLYVHDYTVCFHMMLQTGIKGIYPVSRTDRQIEEEVKKDLTEKLSGYLLWLEEEEINVQADPVSLTVSLSGTGGAFPTEQISIKQKLYRIKPCEMIRRSRWLRNRGGESDGDTL